MDNGFITEDGFINYDDPDCPICDNWGCEVCA